MTPAGGHRRGRFPRIRACGARQVTGRSRRSL